MTLGAQILDGPAEQAPLHACLHHQRKIGHRQHLDAGDGSADVPVAAVFFAEAVLGGPVGRHDLHLLRHFGAGDDGVGRVVRPEDFGGKFGAHGVLDISPTAVEGVAQVLRSGGHGMKVSPRGIRQTRMWQTLVNLVCVKEASRPQGRMTGPGPTPWCAGAWVGVLEGACSMASGEDASVTAATSVRRRRCRGKYRRSDAVTTTLTR